MKTVLLTDGEFTGMIRSLKSLREPARVIGFVSGENVAHTAFLDRAIAAPSWREESYLPFLKRIAVEEKVDLIFPVITTSLEWMAEKAEEIRRETGAIVVTAPAESIRVANNKALLLEALRETELSRFITPFRQAATVGELRAAARDFGEGCVSKPVRGENAEGFLRFVSAKEYALRRLEGGASSLACLEMLDALPDDASLPEERLVMPYLPGEEWDVDVLARNGEAVAVTVRKNLEMFGGLSACTVTVDRPDLLECCRGIVKKLGLEYLNCISFRADEMGCPKLMEINPRAMGSIHLSTLAGNALVEKLFSFPELGGEGGALPRETAVTRPGFMAALYNDLAVVSDPGENEIQWNEISPPVRGIYEEYYARTGSRITDIVFNCRFAWDSVYHFRWTIMEDCFVQASYGGPHSDPFLMMPLGDLTAEKLERIMNRVREDFSRRGLPLTVYGIDEKVLPLFEELTIPHEAPVYNDDFSDYLYNAEDLRTLPGKKYSKKRNHLTRFFREHPDYVYEKLDSRHFEGCLALIRRWAEEKGVPLEDADSSDYLVIENLLRHWDRLNARGGVILLDGRVAAFSLGSMEQDTAFIHFEKADASVEGLYAAINQLVLVHEFPEAVYVNREEDLGIPGLRKAKQSYYPVAMVRKYKMRIL